MCCCLCTVPQNKKKHKLSRTTEWDECTLEMQHAKILRIPSIHTMIVQLQSGAVVETGLSTPLLQEQWETLSQSASATSPLQCRLVLGDYNMKFSRFCNTCVEPEFDPTPARPPLRFERMQYGKRRVH